MSATSGKELKEKMSLAKRMARVDELIELSQQVSDRTSCWNTGKYDREPIHCGFCIPCELDKLLKEMRQY